jgi:hypothetical protein
MNGMIIAGLFLLLLLCLSLRYILTSRRIENDEDLMERFVTRQRHKCKCAQRIARYKKIEESKTFI